MRKANMRRKVERRIKLIQKKLARSAFRKLKAAQIAKSKGSK